MEPSLALQAAIYARLVATAAVTALVPASNILDRNATPALDNSIVLGEGQTVPDDGLARNRHRVYADIHIWRKEKSTVEAKKTVGAIRDALNDGPLTLTGFHVADMHITSTRFMRDPGGEHSHAVITLECRVLELT